LTKKTHELLYILVLLIHTRKRRMAKQIKTKDFLEKYAAAHKKEQSLESFAKELGLTTKQVIAKRNTINNQFSKAGQKIRIPKLSTNPPLSVDEMAELCKSIFSLEAITPKEKTPKEKTKTVKNPPK
jgi:LysM repeat protein